MHDVIWSHFDKCGTSIAMADVSKDISGDSYDENGNVSDRITINFAHDIHEHRNEVLTRLEGNPNKPMLLAHEGLRNRDSTEDAKLEGGKISLTESEKEDDLSWVESNSPISSGLQVGGDDENLSYQNDRTFSDDLSGELSFGEGVCSYDEEDSHRRIIGESK